MRRNRDAWPRTTDTRAGERAPASHRRDVAGDELDVAPPSVARAALRALLVMLSGTELGALDVAEDGTCADCGGDGWRWLVGLRELCGDCARRRVRARARHFQQMRGA